MWNSYFFQIQSKYSMRVSFKNPLVIRLDGKDVTKNKNMICWTIMKEILEIL